ncbi:MAG: hypothetical protein U9R11_05655 [Chloroflexota bacterium]|nr:hypothetical protein [Chloroflexota bacterium]
MGFLKKVASLFSPGEGEAGVLWVYVRCDKCGEKLKSRIDLQRDLTPSYGEGEAAYFLRKVLIGSGRCFQPIEVRMTFDARRKLVSREITGGRFITKEEYEAED